MNKSLIAVIVVVIIGTSIVVYLGPLSGCKAGGCPSSSTSSSSPAPAYSYSRNSAGGLIEPSNPITGALDGCNTLASTITDDAGYKLQVYVSGVSPKISDNGLCIHAQLKDNTTDSFLSVVVTDSSGTTMANKSYVPSFVFPVAIPPAPGANCTLIWDMQAPNRGCPSPARGLRHQRDRMDPGRRER